MTVLFDDSTGRLRLDEGSWTALTRWSTGEQQLSPQVGALRKAGVIAHSQPHASLAPALKAWRDPVCSLAVQLDRGDGSTDVGTGRAAPEAAALLLSAPDDLLELVTVHPTFLPAGLWRVLGMGPRPRTDAEPVQVPVHLFERMLGNDLELREAAVDRLLSGGGVDANHPVLRALAGTDWTRWNAAVEWEAPQGRRGRRALTVLDTAAGVWLIEDAGPHGVVWPSTPTVVWRALTLLLPGDDELNRSA